MEKEKVGVIRLPESLVERLRTHRRPHQAIAGVIEELLDMSDKLEGISKPKDSDTQPSHG